MDPESEAVELTEEQAKGIVDAVVAALLKLARDDEKARKAPPAKAQKFSYIPRGLDANKGFGDAFYPGWADDLAPACPVRVVSRPILPQEAPSSVLRLLEPTTELEIDPEPILAVWKADRRLRQGGLWMDPETGERVGGVPTAEKVQLTEDDKRLLAEQTGKKWREWLGEKSAVVMLEARMLAKMVK